MNILITGGSGFIGTNVIDYFCKQYSVLNIDILPPRKKEHNEYWVKCDILELGRYSKIVTEFSPDYVIHLAARTDLREHKDISGYAANTIGVSNTINVVKQCKNVKRVLFASSRLVCRIDHSPKDYQDYCPPNLYGESKVIGEKLTREIGDSFEWLSVRPTSIWGPWFDVPYKNFFDTIRKRQFVYPGKFNPKKSFGYIGNTVFQLKKLLFADKQTVHKQFFYLCDYPPLELREWANLIRKEMSLGEIRTAPFGLLKALALLGDLLVRFRWYNFPLTNFRLNNLITDMVYETVRLQKICGELPYSLQEGVEETVKYLNLQS